MSRVIAIMPVRNEARHLQHVLAGIAAQDFDRNRLYFVAVDGDSDDGSGEMLRRWLRDGDIQGTVAENPRRKIPVALNIGLTFASDDDLVVRLDAHTIYEPSYLSQAVDAFERAPADVGCVGGAHVPAAPATFSKGVVAALYTNPMGLGGADFRLGNDIREVDHIYLGVWRAAVLRHAGGFNEQLDANEDAEMSARIRRLGYRILRVPLPCRFIVNRGLWDTIRQWHRYGYWRCKMLQKNRSFIRRRHLITPAAALFAAALVFSPARLLLLPIAAIYWLLIVRSRQPAERYSVTLATFLFFPVVQFAFAVGMLEALIPGIRQRGRTVDGKPAVAAD